DGSLSDSLLNLQKELYTPHRAEDAAKRIILDKDDVARLTTLAQTAERDAKTSASEASQSNLSAKSSAATATTHATSARQSATLASSEVAKIAQHESNAVTASNTAQQSATLATSKATEASQSANTAQSSATSAVASATTATTKANEASTSATTSTIRATEASQSATSAKQEADRATHVLSNAASLTNNNAFAGNQTFNAPVAFNSAVKSSAPICVTNRDNGYCVASSIDMNNIGTQGQSALASMFSVRHVALNYANITIPTDIFIDGKTADGITLYKKSAASVDQTVYHVFGYAIQTGVRISAIVYPSIISMGRGLCTAFEFGNTNNLANGAVGEPNSNTNNTPYSGHSVSGFELGGTPNNLRSYNTSFPTNSVGDGFSKVNHRFEKIFTYHELNIFDEGWNTQCIGFLAVCSKSNGYIITKGDLYLILPPNVLIWLCPCSMQYEANMMWFVKKPSLFGSSDVSLVNPIIYKDLNENVLSQLDQMSRFEPNVTYDGDIRRGPATAFEIVVRMCDLKGIPDTALCAATSAVEWATIQQASGTADANIRVRVEANTTGAIRRGYFSVNVVWDDYGHCNFTTYINIEQEA
ncbi:MAG: hypothetical protein RR808_08000, partial [Akkermansia sp.]